MTPPPIIPPPHEDPVENAYGGPLPRNLLIDRPVEGVDELPHLLGPEDEEAELPGRCHEFLVDPGRIFRRRRLLLRFVVPEAFRHVDDGPLDALVAIHILLTMHPDPIGIPQSLHYLL